MFFSDAQGQISQQAPQVSFLDHGFLFGDSIYEVVRSYNRRLFTWQEHIERLEASSKRLGIDISEILQTLEARVVELFRAANYDNAACRIIITRGPGPLHIDTRQCHSPRCYLALWEFDRHQVPDQYRLIIPKIRRNHRDALDPAIKSGNYLNNVLALREAHLAGFDDSLMLNTSGHITELTTSNIAWIKNGELRTPSLNVGILSGVTRLSFKEFCPELVESEYLEEEILDGAQLFALSTLKEILPVTEFQGSDGALRSCTVSDELLDLKEAFSKYIDQQSQNGKTY